MSPISVSQRQRRSVADLEQLLAERIAELAAQRRESRQ